jgi:hypothetical protein
MALLSVAAASRRRMPVTTFRFRHKRDECHSPSYDVVLSIGHTGKVCRIEIRQASTSFEDALPFTSGRLSAERLRQAVDLLGLVDRVIALDKTDALPGALVFSARLKASAVIRPPVHIWPAGGKNRLAPRLDWLSITARTSQLRAFRRLRYPLHPVRAAVRGVRENSNARTPSRKDR